MGNKRRLILFLMKILLILVMMVCLTEIGQAYYFSARHKWEQAALEAALETAEQDGTEEAETEEESVFSETEEESVIQEPRMSEKFAVLYESNNDLVGWLSIPGMGIDYPVVRCEDGEYYLHHNFYGEEDRYGCLFVKDFADVDTPDTNVIIYGHNMKDGSMFGDLDEYKSEEFCAEHPLIYFDTLYEERTYEVMAVFLSQVYGHDEEVFKYYEFYRADTEEEFLSFYEAVTDMSLYGTGVTAEFGDAFLTLSTCAYHVEDGRLVVVARQCGE